MATSRPDYMVLKVSVSPQGSYDIKKWCNIGEDLAEKIVKTKEIGA
jgi:hypothetical protein